MRKRYLLRLDDACPVMDDSKWSTIESILDKYKIYPLVGIVPHCKDSNITIDNPNDLFWQKAISWQMKGWTIALHGFDHCYLTNEGGINPIHKRSEYAGVDLKIQKEKIKSGYEILVKHKLNPTVFYAPSHTFDDNTITALLEETPIRIISDTIAIKPYCYKGMTIIPQQVGMFRNIPLAGDYTFCFHPNNMTDEAFDCFEKFIVNNKRYFCPYSEITESSFRNRNLLEIMFQKFYYIYRRLRERKSNMTSDENSLKKTISK